MHRIVVTYLLAFLPCLASGQTGWKSGGAQLPDPNDLRQRAMAGEAKLEAELERYDCRVSDEATELDSTGKVKRTDTQVHEQFYVNGVEIQRLLAKNGKNLTPAETRKEDERVMKETLKYSDPAKAKKVTDEQSREVLVVLTATTLTHGHREQAGGRSVLFYDIEPNSNFQAKNLKERFAQTMQGKIAIDEETGEPIDITVRSTRDLKVAGGLLVSLHKGLWLHVHDHAQPDGVWLMDLAEGSGDARAALFLHTYFRFRETRGDCHLYSATATQAGQASVVK